MNVLFNLINFYNHLPQESTSRNIIKAMLAHLPELENITIDELAGIVSASRTTVWRIIKQMGYNDYHAFSHELNRALQKFSMYNRADMGIAISDPGEIRKKLISHLQRVEDSVQRVDMAFLEQVTDMVYRANRVSFYCLSNEYVSNLQLNLAITGRQSGVFFMKPDMMADAQTADENSLVFIKVLEFTEVMDIKDIFEELKARGCKIILFSSQYSSIYGSYADVCVQQEFMGGSSILSETVFMAMLNEMYRGRYIK